MVFVDGEGGKIVPVEEEIIVKLERIKENSGKEKSLIERFKNWYNERKLLRNYK